MHMMAFDGGGGTSGPEEISYYQLNEVWIRVKTACNNAYTADNNEATKAKAKAKADGACEKGDDFDGRINEFKGRYDGVIQRIDGAIGGAFKNNDGVGKKLQAKKADWDEVARRIRDVNGTVNERLTMDKWISDGAKGYQAALPTQQKALTELEGMATSQGQAVDQIGLMNAWIYANAHAGLVWVESSLQTKPEFQLTDEAWGRVGGALDNKWVFDYPFFWRSADNFVYLESFANWCDQVQNSSSADWAIPANNLGGGLKAIEEMPVNLKPGAKWPEGKAQETGDAAATWRLDHQSTYVGGANRNVNTEGGDINFDRTGMG